ncbi:MFS transporter [Nocardioides houyundeii]|uniref:MFS transporter n=1 Tax=Nocardioides houyundeii TaxID=2045452 RepID=UPI000C788F94|nr:MFS transporter [Nocardioides houyundeii]
MSPLASYRRLLDLVGPAYVLVAFIGRLPTSMSQLGTLVLISSTTGSYASGGLAAGALAIANAVGSPLAGALSDRHGQRPVVLVQSLLGALALGVLVIAAHADCSTPVLVLCAAVAGSLLPQVGPLSRVRWRPLVADSGVHHRRLLDTAFSYEGAADEASFVLGPALVGTGVALISPEAAMLMASALLVVFGCAFALHPTAPGAVPRPAPGTVVARVVTPFFVVLLLALMCVGMLFGATQTGTTVMADAAGEPGLAGLIHAVLGIGSVIAGLGTALLPESFGHARRMLVCAVALLVMSLPLLAVDSLTGLVLVVLALGFGVAPYLISVFTLGERALPQSRASLGLSLLASAVGLGYALGAGAAGRLADAHGHTAAFTVTVGAMVLAVVLALVVRARDRSGPQAAAGSAAEPAHPLLDVV